MSYRYTDEDYLNMVICYHDAGELLSSARRLFHERHGRLLNLRTILGAVQRQRETGSFRPRTEGAGRPGYPSRLEDNVLDFFRRYPHASSADAAKRFNVSAHYALDVLHRNGLYPYHIMRVQEILPPDCEKRMEFCQWLQRNNRSNILWTDESTFTRVGLFNIHNAHNWCIGNPRDVRPDHFQHKVSVNVWAGLLNEELLGPVFLDHLNADTYLQFLQTVLPELLAEVPVISRRFMYFQQDGAPAHYSRVAREYLDQQYPGRWIGRGGPVAWPPRSPDLTPLDFHVWGRAKDLVYGHDGHTIRTAAQLRERIIRAFDIMRSDRQVLRKVRRHCVARANVCVQEDGGYVQHLMKQ